jgi:hypothetical protein
MSYAIGYIIYGVPYSEEIDNLFESDVNDNEDIEEMSPEDLGFELVYSGSADIRPGWCGVHLDTIDECGTQRVKDLILSPTEQQKQEAITKINALPENIKKLCDEVDTYIIWGSS